MATKKPDKNSEEDCTLLKKMMQAIRAGDYLEVLRIHSHVQELGKGLGPSTGALKAFITGLLVFILFVWIDSYAKTGMLSLIGTVILLGHFGISTFRLHVGKSIHSRLFLAAIGSTLLVFFAYLLIRFV